jgi:outer membrane protein TolC
MFFFALSLSLCLFPLAGEAARRTVQITEALDLASAGADEIRARDGAVASSMAAVDAARANFLPKITSSVSGGWLANPPLGVTLKAGEMGVLPAALGGAKIPSTDLTFIDNAKPTWFKGNLTLSQPLFTWGKIGSAAAIAGLEAQIAVAGREGAILNVRRQVETTYFTVRFCRETRALSLGSGLSTQEQLLSSKADLADIDARIVEVDETERTALYSLGILTGLDTASIDLVSACRTEVPVYDEAALEDRASRTGESAVTARVRLSEANKKLALAKGSMMLLPDLQFFSSLDVSGQTVPFSGSIWLDKTWTWDLTVGIAAKTDLFDGGASYANIREAKAGLDAATAALSGQENAARLAARNAADTARKTQADIMRKTARCAWYAEALKAAQSSFKNQVISRAELNGASMREILGRIDLLQAQYNLEQAIADLELVNGRSFR